MRSNDVNSVAPACIQRTTLSTFLLWICMVSTSWAQDEDPSKVDLGSRTAKDGFRNEDEIRDKFNAWKTDKDAKAWLKAMDYKLQDIIEVKAIKPHGYKADVEVTITARTGKSVERLSIKLVSSENGFNQIDKRWLDTYAKMWEMPDDVVKPLKYFVGELRPYKSGRHKERMYLNELSKESRKAVLDFFQKHKKEIVSDLLSGDGEHSANWFMVTFKAYKEPRWLIRSSTDAADFFGEGEVVMTRAGNLKIGRIGMQRKGGDNGRKTARMLQFKINPVQLFDAK